MSRSPSPKEGLNRGAWTVVEDQLLIDYVRNHGEGKWGKVSKETGLKRCGKSCRLRWLNYLRPDIKRGNITQDEIDLIVRLHRLLGNRWSLIAGRLPGRTANEIKNYWNCTLKKKVEATCHSNQSENEKQVTRKPSCEVSPSFTVTRSTNTSLPSPPPPFLAEENNTTVFEESSKEGCLMKSVIEELDSNDVQISCENDVLWEFMMNLNTDQISLSDFLHTDFSKFCHSNAIDAEAAHFSDTAVNNWTIDADECTEAEK